MVRHNGLNGGNEILELRVGCFRGLDLEGMKHLLVVRYHGLDVGLVERNSRLFFQPLELLIVLRSGVPRQRHVVVRRNRFQQRSRLGVIRHHRLRKLFDRGAAGSLQSKLREGDLSMVTRRCLLKEGLFVCRQGLRAITDPGKTSREECGQKHLFHRGVNSFAF
jgi:hypothetical protein